MCVCVCSKTFQIEIQNLKDQVQELHRDLTKHHSIINTDKMGEILDRSLHVDSQIASQYSAVETMRVMFEEVQHLDALTFSVLPTAAKTKAFTFVLSQRLWLHANKFSPIAVKLDCWEKRKCQGYPTSGAAAATLKTLFVENGRFSSGLGRDISEGHR